MSLFDRVKAIFSPTEAKPRVADASRGTAETPRAGVDDAATRAQAMQLIDRGNTLENSGRADEAMPLYEAAIALRPDLARGYINRGNVLVAKGDVDAGIAAYREALRAEPTSAAAHFNLGHAFLRIARPEDAIVAFRRALDAKPDFTDAEVTLGYVYDELGRFDEAVAAYRRALRLQPDYAEVHHNLGVSLLSLGQVADAIASSRRAVALNPDYASARNGLGNALKAGGDLPGALAEYARALDIDPAFADALSGLIFTRNYLANGDRGEDLALARRYGSLVTNSARPYRQWQGTPDPERPLRVGLVSGDLREHPVGHFLESALAALRVATRGDMTLHAYANQLRSDDTTARLRAACDAWTVVAGMDDATFAQRVHADGIDLLIDLSGHTGLHRLAGFAWKPAPVQVAWLGYFGTTGVPAIDVLIADPLALPIDADMEADFTETVWRLPETRLCFTPPTGTHPVSDPPAQAAGIVTFGNFSHLTKLNDDTVALWSRVLDAVPGSRLRLKAPQLADAATRTTTLARFATHGIDAARIDLLGPSPRADYLDAYNDIDIILDTFPYPGGTTTAEALWMGVPVLSLAGDRFLSRQGASLLGNAGLADWVASDPDDFVARAADHAGDIGKLAALRARLRRQVLASPLFDAPRFAGHLHAALRDIWRQSCRRRSDGDAA